MKRIEELAKGLLILSGYDEKGFSTAAEHDIVYAGPSEDEVVLNEDGEVVGGKTVVSAKDAKRLTTLGWHIDSETNSWAFYT